jgi:tetratricopeptide (TPR) repeat protein
MHDQPATHGPSLPVLTLILALAIGLVYSNCLDNSFQLDDGYGLSNNPWVRNLSYIPQYFTDPFTLTTLKSNADYRPILQITYALNYAISGYKTWSWHLFNLGLHLLVSVALFCLGRALIGSRRILPISWLSEAEGDTCAAFAALLHAVHPIGTGCVNYMWARSSLLVATFGLPSIVLYLASFRGGKRFYWGALLLFVLALFTKAEAVSLFGVYFLAELILSPDVHETPLLGRVLRRSLLLRLLPFAVSLLLYLLLRQALLPRFLEDARHAADVTSYHYLLTQFRVWWFYIGRMMAPVNLVADDTSYRVSRTLTDPVVIYSLAGWAITLAVAALLLRPAPAMAWCFFFYFVILSPTSSVAPLAEMHNEHRPYLPTAALWLLVAAGLFLILRALTPRPRRGLALLALLLVPALGYLSHDRNRTWRDDLTLWEDVAEKVPGSSRGQMNYGLALMARARFPEAEARFREANRLAPNYIIPWINLGIVLAAQNRIPEARAAYDRAVAIDPNDETSLLWRGRFLEQSDLPRAIEDYKGALARDKRNLEAMELLASALIRAGRADEARPYIVRGLPLEPDRFRPLEKQLPKR